MRKSIYVIAVMGLAACLAMSLLMKHLLGKREEHKNPLVYEAQELFGGRLDGPVDWRVEERDGKRVGVLSITPLTAVSNDRLAKDIGQYIWRSLKPDERPDQLEVHCADPRSKDPEVVQVPPPYLRGGSRQSSDSARPPGR